MHINYLTNFSCLMIVPFCTEHATFGTYTVQIRVKMGGVCSPWAKTDNTQVHFRWLLLTKQQNHEIEARGPLWSHQAA